MTGLLSRWRRRGHIRRALHLRKRLRALYGPSDLYTFGQVRRAATEAGLRPRSLDWAAAVHCSRAEFEEAGREGDYAAMRRLVEAEWLDEPIGFDRMEGLPQRHETVLSATTFGGLFLGLVPGLVPGLGLGGSGGSESGGWSGGGGAEGGGGGGSGGGGSGAGDGGAM